MVQDSDRGPQTVEERPPANFQPDGEIDIQELLRKFWRRKWIILGTVIAVMTLVGITLSQLTPRYTAVNKIEISPARSNVVDFEAVLAGLPADTATIETEIQILRSRNLIAKTVERLKLNRNPEFNAVVRPPTTFAMFRDRVRGFLVERGLTIFAKTAEVETLSQTEKMARVQNQIIDVVLDKLKVEPKGMSRVVSVLFESENPRTAALVANTLADFYIVAQLEAKFDATKRANSWLNDRVLELRQEVSATERAIEAYRAKFGLIRGDKDATVTSEQISFLGVQYIQERTKLAEAEARLRQVEKLLKSADGIESAGDVLASRLIQSLREQEAKLESQTAELSAELGERHPRMINARAQLRDLRGKIRVEVGRVVQGLRNEVGVARARTASLRRELDKTKKEVARLDTYQVQIRALEREAAASGLLLETLLARSKETASQQNFQEADANILSYAPVPTKPSYPRKILILAGSTVFAIILGVLMAFAVEQFDVGFRSSEQVGRMMGLASLGLVPALTGLAAVGRKPERYILEKPASAFGEAIRRLYTILQLSGVEKPPKLIMICSSLPKEGKTTIVVSLSRMLASIGQKVIVVDCDLRRPTVHTSFGLPSSPGLVEYLSGEITLDEVIQEDQSSGAHLISSGASAAHRVNLLGSESMNKLLNSLNQRYDIVIMDSSPVLAVSDSLVLSRLADKIVFLVRWAETRRETAINGVRQIIDAGGNVAGVLLTMVDVKEHAKYGFGDSGSYTGTIKKYYSG